MFQEFDFEEVVKIGKHNIGLELFSILEFGEVEGTIDDNLPYAQRFCVDVVLDQFIDIVTYFTTMKSLILMTEKEPNDYKVAPR